ncbi:MAG: NHL repeat-containing protein [Bacteroidota bacterium]|nr:NHL repeat-containing protein [Bacteroidota bacterium]
MKSYLSILLFVLSTAVYSQNFQFVKAVGSFYDAASFYISPTDFIYITDISTNEITKLSLDGEVLKTAGGTGWDNEAFDCPNDVFASVLYVMVADKNNHSIKLFDRDLNFNSVLSTREADNPSAQFGFPLACVYSKQGDMFILDSENKRIVKFDIFRNFSSNFGGFDYGKFALSNPSKMAISNNNDLYVLDNKKLVLFDQFGTGIKIENLKDSISDIRIISNIITLTGKNKIYISDLNNNSNILLSQVNIDLGDAVAVSSIYYKDRFYILTKSNILIYQKVE